MFVTLFQRKWGLHLSPQVAGSGAQARKFGGLRAPLTLFVKHEWVGMSGGGDGPEISPHTQRLNCINGQLLREARCSRLYTTLSHVRVFLGHSPSPSLVPRCCCLLRQLRADHEHIGLLPPGTWVFPSRCGVSGSRAVGHGGSGRAETHGRCLALSPMCCGGLSGFLPGQPHGTQFLPGGKTFPAGSAAVSPSFLGGKPGDAIPVGAVSYGVHVFSVPLKANILSSGHGGDSLYFHGPCPL